jgi:hypothetical protein
MTDQLTDQVLSRALKTVAWAAVPDSALPELSELRERQPMFEGGLNWDALEAAMAPPRRRRRLGRELGAVVGVLALAGAGTGIAAAAGAFSPQQEASALLGPATGNVLPTGKWTAANVTTRLSKAGPDGSTLTLQSASADPAGGCTRLIVSPPRPDATGTVVTCTAHFNLNHPPVTHTPTNTNYGTGGATFPWVSPTGARWTFVYGRCPTQTAVKAAAVTRAGAILATTLISNGGWYILPVPTTENTVGQPGEHLVYYASTGKQTNAFPDL